MSKAKPYVISFAVTYLVAILGGIITYAGQGDFQVLNQPPLSPPAILFPIVWSLLYGLMAFGAARVYIKNNRTINSALIVYAVQLVFNFFWCVFFFGFGSYLLSFVWLIALWLLVLRMILLFRRTDKLSAFLQIPYLLWLTFAAYLNLGIYLLN